MRRRAVRQRRQAIRPGLLTKWVGRLMALRRAVRKARTRQRRHHRRVSKGRRLAVRPGPPAKWVFRPTALPRAVRKARTRNTHNHRQVSKKCPPVVRQERWGPARAPAFTLSTRRRLHPRLRTLLLRLNLRASRRAKKNPSPTSRSNRSFTGQFFGAASAALFSSFGLCYAILCCRAANPCKRVGGGARWELCTIVRNVPAIAVPIR
jgi:hypothetical protein